MKTVLLWLEAPLQSWGVSSRFGRRDTLPFPTRSGVLGLLCCAMGRGGEQRGFLADMAECGQHVAAYARTGRGGPESNPFLMDFQMVGSGYDSSDKWQDLNIPRKSDGSKPVGAGTKMTYRFYIQDMAFACAAEVPDGYLAEVEEALRCPVWPICLGRRSCVPAAPVYAGTFDSVVDALAAGEALAASRGRVEAFRAVPETEGGETLVLNDVPVAFGLHKEYRDRRVTVVIPG